MLFKNQRPRRALDLINHVLDPGLRVANLPPSDISDMVSRHISNTSKHPTEEWAAAQARTRSNIIPSIISACNLSKIFVTRLA